MVASWSGGRGQLPTRGSHRSGRAQFGHPAPRMMASLLRRTQFRYLAGLRRDDLSAQCPRHLSPRKSHPPVGRFPSAGSLGAGSPTSPVLSADSDFSPPLAPRFVSFARHYHRFAPLRSPGAGRLPEDPDYFYRGARAASRRWRKRDLPGSWTTLAYMLRSPTPADHRPPGHYSAGDGVFRTDYYVDSAMMLISGLNHAACTLPVYASRPRSPQDAQHSVPAGGQPWPGRTLACGVAQKVSVMSIPLHGILLHQALPGAPAVQFGNAPAQ